MPLILRYGALIGLSQFLATLLVFAFGLHGSAQRLADAQFPESLIGFILLMAVIAFAHLAAKKTSADNKGLKFGAAAKFATLTALVGGLVTGVTQYAYLAFINPALRDLQHAEIMERVKTTLPQLPPDEIARVVKQIDYATSAAARGLVYGLNTVVFATLLGLAFALIFRAAGRRDAAPEA